MLRNSRDLDKRLFSELELNAFVDVESRFSSVGLSTCALYKHLQTHSLTSARLPIHSAQDPLEVGKIHSDAVAALHCLLLAAAVAVLAASAQ